MKRIAWLLLAISLPAWATINGVDSSRVVLPSFDGTRYGAYVAGDYPETPPGVIWTQDFEGIANGTVFSKSNMDSTYEALEGLGYNSDCHSGISISDAVARAGSQALKIFNNVSEASDSQPPGCSTTIKARVELLLGANQYALTGSIGDGNGWPLGSERWLGYSVYFPTSGNGGWSSVSPDIIIFQLVGNNGDDADPISPILYLVLSSNGALGVDTAFSAEAGDIGTSQDYLKPYAWTSSWTRMTDAQWATLKSSGTSGVTEAHLKIPSSVTLQRDRWYDVIIHFGKGETFATGVIEIWLRDTSTSALTKIVDIPAFPTTRRDFPTSYLKTGWYSSLTTTSKTYTMYVDSWRAYDEQGTFNAVDPAQDD